MKQCKIVMTEQKRINKLFLPLIWINSPESSIKSKLLCFRRHFLLYHGHTSNQSHAWRVVFRWWTNHRSPVSRCGSQRRICQQLRRRETSESGCGARRHWRGGWTKLDWRTHTGMCPRLSTIWISKYVILKPWKNYKCLKLSALFYYF